MIFQPLTYGASSPMPDAPAPSAAPLRALLFYAAWIAAVAMGLALRGA